MTQIADTGWALRELDAFVRLTSDVERRAATGGRAVIVHVGTEEEIANAYAAVRHILTRLDPAWEERLEHSQDPARPWIGHRRIAVQARADLDRAVEIRERLGDDAPRISASALHPWAWESARALWLDGHYRQALATAAIKISAETQRKTGVRDRSEADLFTQLFKLDPPKAGHPRLRLMENDGSRTYTSLHEGAGSFARGCYMAIRNPNSHTDELPVITEPEALEQLAAFSRLARWVSAATVETAE